MRARRDSLSTSAKLIPPVLCLLIAAVAVPAVAAGGYCAGTLDYRGANCNTWKRYQCAPWTDCAAHNCTFYGDTCYWRCDWQPDAYTCEYPCNSKPVTPCQYRTTQSFCELGWGCYWVPPEEPEGCVGTLDYRGANCNTWKRYQCTPGTDCQANNCTFYGSGCYWPCNSQPYGYTCEYTCDSKPVVPCTQRATQAFCELGWGCRWE